jgi:hypothetical protein
MGYLKRIGDKRYRVQYDRLPENDKRRLKRETLDNVTKKQAETILAQRDSRSARQQSSHSARPSKTATRSKTRSSLANCSRSL